MNKQTLYDHCLDAVTSGGSGRGMSFYSDAAQCGKRALLRERLKASGRFDSTEGQLGEGPLVVGNIYHRLHELWRTDVDCEYDFNEPIENKSVAAALDLFRGWRGMWNRDFWGKCVAVEKQLPCTPAGEERVHHALKHLVTAKVDMCVDVREEDLNRIQTRIPGLDTPGRYIVDWKTAGGKYGEMYYSGGLQALWYPAAWELEPETGDEAIIGTIFDIIMKPRRNAKDKTYGADKFAAYMVPHFPGSESALTGLVEQASTNLRRAEHFDLGNRAECVKFGFGDAQVCPFYGTDCPGA